VILGCLAYDPAKRFQSAGEALTALDGSGSASRPVSTRRPPTRRRVLAVGAGAAAVSAGALWLSAPKIEALLNPLPAQRFVALLAWPPEPNSPARSLLKVVLDAVANRLARAESSIKSFAVFAPGDGGPAPKALKDVVGSLGANLVLAVSLRAAGAKSVLGMQILAAATGKVLRRRTLEFTDAELSGLAGKASVAAAGLLDLPAAPAALKDQDELAKLAPAAYRLFSEAEDLREQPNNAGLAAAIEKYQKVLEMEPRFAMGYATLALAYTAKYDQSKDTAFLHLAERNAVLAVQYNPDSAKGAIATAIVNAKSGNTGQAIAAIAKAVELDPGNPQVLLYKGITYHDLARFREEEEVYREIVRQRPNYWLGYNQLGWFLFRQTRYREAAAAFGEAAAVSVKVALPLANQGGAYLSLEQYSEAESALRRSLERAPTEFAYSNLGTIAFKRREYQKALDAYNKALEINPNNFRTWRNVADCYATLGNPKREADAFRKASEILTNSLRSNPLSGTNWSALAFCNAKLGLREQAADDLKQADAHGIDQRAQFMKAQTLAVLGRKEEALNLVLSCLDHGLSETDVDLALDLKEIRSDPRYRRHLAAKGPTQ
jgi:tetratricopeptide (TPR) repeat protein